MNKLYNLFILPHKMYKKRKKEIDRVQNESGEEALNRNQRAYNIRLPQLNQLMHSIIKLLMTAMFYFHFLRVCYLLGVPVCQLLLE